MADYLPGHPFENEHTANESNRTSAFFYGWIERLSFFLTPEQVVDLSRQFQCCPDADLYRLATNFHRRSTSLSDSQTSSYLSNFSHQSFLSTSSTYSRESAGSDNCPVEHEPMCPDIFDANPSSGQLPTLQSSFQPSLPGQQNQDSLYTLPAAQRHKPFCFACNEQFKNKGSLKRHQQEQCERERIFACPLCPLPQAIYYTRERLIRHHIRLHGDNCPHDCSKNENQISDVCKEHLSGSFEKLPAKKAWGCPYCVRCFRGFEDWHRHCTEHLTKADTATTWSFGTMIESLLEQESLRAACLRHEFPVTRNWSSINEKTCTGLREVLEHCKLPSGLRAREYCYLSASNAVVRCVFDIIISGQTFPSQQLFDDLVQNRPLPNQGLLSVAESLESVSCTLEEFLREGNMDNGVKKTHYSQPRLANEPTIHPLAKNARLITLPSSSLLSNMAGDEKARSALLQTEDDGSGGPIRRRGAGLKRSLSNLALRPSSSKSSLGQTMAAPPVPPLPDEAKASKADKAGAGANHDGAWSTHGYLDPIPQHRPMSGIVYGFSWSDGSHTQQ